VYTDRPFPKILYYRIRIVNWPK